MFVIKLGFSMCSSRWGFCVRGRRRRRLTKLGRSPAMGHRLLGIICRILIWGVVNKVIAKIRKWIKNISRFVRKNG